MMTPSALSGAVMCAVTEHDLFLMLTTLFSDSRFMPGNSSCELPVISWGRPARSGFIRSAARSSSGSTLYLTASISHSRWSSCNLPRRLGVVEAVDHRGPLHRGLLDAVDEGGLGNPGGLQDGGCDVDDMAELGPGPAARGDA